MREDFLQEVMEICVLTMEQRHRGRAMKHLQKCRYDVCGAQDVFWTQRTGAEEAGRSQAVDIPGVPCFSGFSLLGGPASPPGRLDVGLKGVPEAVDVQRCLRDPDPINSYIWGLSVSSFENLILML